jgi:hypothetical protein
MRASRFILENKDKEVASMNAWESIFEQSPANNGHYKEDVLTEYFWDWPRGTWLQDRLEYVREHEPTAGLKSLRKLLGALKPALN